MNQKVRKMGLKQKIMIPFSILMVIICLLLSATSFLSEKEKLVAMAGEEAALAAKASAGDIDIDTLETLEPGCMESAEYAGIFDSMMADKESYGIMYMYTLYGQGDTIYYGVDADDTDNQSDFGDEFEYAEDAAPAFAGETAVDDKITVDEDDYCISVYMPLKDSAGQVVAVLACDYDASKVNADLNAGLERSVFMAVAAVIVAILMAGILAGAIRKNVLAVNQKIYDLVHSDGDLTQRLDVTSGDELELIADNVNELIAYIHEIMSEVAINSKSLNGASVDAARNMEDANRGILEVSATMEQMSAAMEETNASMEQILRLVETLDTEIGAISDSAKEGQTKSIDIAANADNIHKEADVKQREAREQSGAMVSSMQEKIENSKAVEKIADLTSEIMSISSQTNLLALNASIEAARAGEAGRGFAVVADEIGNLADNSNKAAAQIKEVSAHVIENVNGLAEEAQRMIDFMNEVSIKGYDLVLSVSDEYSSNISDMADTMTQFAAEAAELREELTSIRDAVESITLAVNESSQGISNVAEASTTLTGSVESVTNQVQENLSIAAKLDDEVGKFKL